MLCGWHKSIHQVPFFNDLQNEGLLGGGENAGKGEPPGGTVGLKRKRSGFRNKDLGSLLVGADQGSGGTIKGS